MPRPKLFTEPLTGGNTFHVYNQTNNNELMFKNEQDRWKFLRNLENFIAPFAFIFNYNLLSNHFHLVIEIFEKEYFMRNTSKQYIESLPPRCKALIMKDEDNMDQILSNRFASMFKGYTHSHNYRHKRVGNLFHRRFCRKLIDTEFYFEKVIYYVHANAVKHHVVEDILDYEWTSFNLLILGDRTFLSLKRLFDRFGGEAELLRYHGQDQILVDSEKYVIEEEDVFRLTKKDVDV